MNSNEDTFFRNNLENNEENFRWMLIIMLGLIP